MMKSYFFIALLALTFIGCEVDQTSGTKEEDQQELITLRNELETVSVEFTCDNAADWKFTPVGAKACGGPTGYVAYSTKIDETLFLRKVALYTEKQKVFNRKWNIVSDCMAIAPPKSIDCVSGKPKFVY